LLHGEDSAAKAAETARLTFEQGTLAADLPTIEIPQADLTAGLGILDAFLRAGLVTSTSDARRQIKGGAVRVNDVKVDDDRQVLSMTDLSDGIVKLSVGKKKHALLKAV